MALTVAKAQAAAQARGERQRPATDILAFARQVAHQLAAELVWYGIGGWAKVPLQEWGSEGSKHATSN